MEVDFEKLVQKAAKDDQEAISTLYEQTYNDVYRAVRSLVTDEDAALDILQDTYIHVFSNLGQLKDPQKFKAWVKVAATNKAKDYLKKKTPILFTDMENAEGDLPEFEDYNEAKRPDMVMDRKATAQLIDQILEGLPAAQRIAVTMYYYNEMSVEAIAKATDSTPSAVKSRLMYGRKHIEQEVRNLEKKGIKLYSLSPLPFFLFLLRQAKANNIPAKAIMEGTASASAQSISQSASAAKTANGTASRNTARKATREAAKKGGKYAAKKATGAAAKTAAASAAGTAAKATGLSLTAKIVAVAAAATITVSAPFAVNQIQKRIGNTEVIAVETIAMNVPDDTLAETMLQIPTAEDSISDITVPTTKEDTGDILKDTLDFSKAWRVAEGNQPEDEAYWFIFNEDQTMLCVWGEQYNDYTISFDGHYSVEGKYITFVIEKWGEELRYTYALDTDGESITLSYTAGETFFNTYDHLKIEAVEDNGDESGYDFVKRLYSLKDASPLMGG